MFAYSPAKNKWTCFVDLALNEKKKRRVQKARPFFAQRVDCSLANFKNQLIVLSGGHILPYYTKTNEVYSYELKQDRWIRAPSLNTAFQSHSSVVIGDSVYVAGTSEANIERFADASMLTHMASDANCWEVLPVRPPVNMCGSLMAPLGANEILFLGCQGNVSRCDVLNLPRLKFRLTVQTERKYEANYGNHYSVSSDGSVRAFVEDWQSFRRNVILSISRAPHNQVKIETVNSFA